MNKRKVRILLVLILIFTFPQMVYADSELIDKSIEAIVPVEQVFDIEGEKPKKMNTSVNYVLKRYSHSYPMPSQSFGDEFKFTIDNSKYSLRLVFDKVGMYEYEVYADMKDDLHYTYDKQHYRIKIAVNELTNGRLSRQIIVLDERGRKPDRLVFRHRYKGKKKPKITIPSTGDMTNINLWIGTGAISLFLSVYLIFKRKSEDK